MNVETIKTELQQVLDSDLALRKEYNELKRSLSDYRNQLIERDEDCKRLQVSIDVLNTKLVVMERDNTNYKGEVAAFKELRHTIKEQLQEKQDEINNLLSKIEGLEAQLGSVSSEYEAKIAELSSSSSNEAESLKQHYEAQLAELRTNSSYQHNGIKSEYESRISELKSSFETQITNTKQSYESRISELTSGFESQITTLKEESAKSISSLSSSSSQEIEEMKTAYEQRIAGIETLHNEEKEQLLSSFQDKIDALNSNFSAEKQELCASYERRIEFLDQQLQQQESGFGTELESRLEALSKKFADKENDLKTYYEEKLANILIHSNAQNTRLAEDSNKFVLENEHFKEKIREMVYHIDAQNTQIETLTRDIEIKSAEINHQSERFTLLSSEFEAYKASQLSSSNDLISGLNQKINELSSMIIEKDSAISTLNTSLGQRATEASALSASNSELQNNIANVSALLNEKEEAFETFKNELEVTHSQELQAREIEFQKLLTENTNLISEIDNTSDRLEAAEAELSLLRAELAEAKALNEGKVEDLKETLNGKNYELTTLAANNSALQTEISLLKAELQGVQGELSAANEANEWARKQQDELDTLLSAKSELESQVAFYQSETNSLQSRIAELNSSIAAYEEQVQSLSSTNNVAEREAFIDGLFKQIDMLNDERFKLLGEKEEMATQLLKMNDSLSGLSQQVDSQNIDISELDMHRKNVILAKSSNGAAASHEKTAMKKQINELVREIDKCIALLSA